MCNVGFIYAAPLVKTSLTKKTKNCTFSGRFISVMKVRPLIWREAHPYLIADRMEDITDPESLRVNPKTDRNISLYGYIRGTSIKNHSNVHIAGKLLIAII